MKNCVIYRFPNEGDQCRYIADAELRTLDSPDAPCRPSAFLFAPFEADARTPVVEVDAHHARAITLDELEALPADIFDIDDIADAETTAPAAAADRQAYAADFATFHDALVRGAFDKLVLSRSHRLPLHREPSCTRLFAAAARQNPNCFVALVSTPLTGTWLTATPETLFEQRGDTCATMALAGTQPLAADGDPGRLAWDDKNRCEQACVSQYIRRQLDALRIHYSESRPTTVRAGSLAHIRTVFTFAAGATHGLSPLQVAATLHPTPAVCGLPADTAKRFILDREHNRRRYYSGFCGTVDGAARQARLFVTLRCMRIGTRSCTLYAGGGLLPESTEADEWTETANKMLAMRRTLDGLTSPT